MDLEDANPDDAEFWDRIYADGTPPWDQKEPAPPLVRLLDEVEPAVGSSVFVPGCGFGQEALFLAGRGLQVTAVDIASAAVTGLQERAAQAGLPVTAVQADLFDLPATCQGPYDCLVEHTCFCAITPQRRSAYVDVAARLVRPGGRLLGLFFEVDHALSEGPPFATTRQDVVDHFSEAFTIDSIEQPVDSFPRRAGREWLVSMTRVTQD